MLIYTTTLSFKCNCWLYIVLAKWQCDPLKTPSFSPSDSRQAYGTRVEDVVSMGRKPGLDQSGWSGHRRWMGPAGPKWTDWEGSWGLGGWQVWWDQGWKGVWSEEAEGIWSQWVWSWGGCWDFAGSLCGYEFGYIRRCEHLRTCSEGNEMEVSHGHSRGKARMNSGVWLELEAFV